MIRFLAALLLVSSTFGMGNLNDKLSREQTQIFDLSRFLKDSTKCAVIYGAYESPEKEAIPTLWKAIWNQAPIRFCIDHGANRLFHHKNEGFEAPTKITGKLDRLDEETKKYFEEKETQMEETYDDEESDTLSTLKSLASEDLDNVTMIVILGGFSGRFDRVLGDLDALVRANALFSMPTVVLNARNLITVLPKGDLALKMDRELLSGTTGFLPILQEKTVVTSAGFKWNLNNEEMKIGERVSTSNQMESDRLEFNTTAPLVFTVEIRESI